MAFIKDLIPALCLMSLLLSTNSHADTADVVGVTVSQSSDHTWHFQVSVMHSDTGWDDYANGWDILLPNGSVLKRSASDQFTRLLLHPHVNEQPFTRSQSGLVIPKGITEVTVRAHTTVEGWGGKELTVKLTF